MEITIHKSLIWKIKLALIYSKKDKLSSRHVKEREKKKKLLENNYPNIVSQIFFSSNSSPDFEFTEDDPDVETVFRSAFGGNRFYYWSFINEENPQWRSSTNYSNNYGRSWSWRNRVDEDYDDSSNEYEDSEANLVTHRLALGLTASGPLKLEDVKKA